MPIGTWKNYSLTLPSQTVLSVCQPIEWIQVNYTHSSNLSIQSLPAWQLALGQPKLLYDHDHVRYVSTLHTNQYGLVCFSFDAGTVYGLLSVLLLIPVEKTWTTPLPTDSRATVAAVAAARVPWLRPVSVFPDATCCVCNFVSCVSCALSCGSRIAQ